MSRKAWIWLGILVGGTLGSFVPALWGASMFSASSVLCSGAGGFLGIYAGYRASNYF